MHQSDHACDFEVVIIGAGPVGTLCAVLLAKHGIRTLLLERSTSILEIPRAISLDNEALRALQAAGVLEFLRDDLPAVPASQLISPFVGDLMRITMQGVSDGHPRLVSFSQPALERALREVFVRHESAQLRLGLECIGLTQDADAVELTCRSGDGTLSTVRAAYAIGTDGANSFVRKTLGIGFDGQTYQEDWLIVDVAAPSGGGLEHVEFFCDPRRPHVHVPGPEGAQRWEFMMMPGETREYMERPETIRALVAPWGDVSTMKVLRTAVYRFHARTAERVRVDRVLLAGDAAHVTPPFAGQGLCSGLRDALNLSWKLAWVLRGRADPSILDSYGEERLPHVRRMIEFAVALGRVIMPTSQFYSRCRDHFIGLLRLLAPARRYFDRMRMKPGSGFMSGLFLTAARVPGLEPGGPIAQGIVRRADGRLMWSDDALGNGLWLVGFGIDPQSLLGDRELDDWRSIGGSCVFLRGRQQNMAVRSPPRSPLLEDETGTYVGERAPVGTLAIVRPDRVVLGVAPHDSAAQLVQAAVRLFRKAH